MAATSGRVPRILLAAVTATSRVRSDTSVRYWAAGSSPVDMSTSAQRTVTLARAAAWIHGRTFASWSSRESTISSPGHQVSASAPASRYVRVVMFGPRMTPRASPPTRSATARRQPVTMALARWLAGNAPPAFPIPARAAAVTVSMTASGTCVPAAPSR